MKAYQIVIKGCPISEKYAELTAESWQPAINAGYIEEIIRFDAITPDSPDFEEHCARYNWQKSKMKADLQGSAPDDHSPTEKAGMCSHWELIRMASETDERFLILEHDTYFLRPHLELFKRYLEYTEKMGVLYLNIGLFMGCYSFEKETAAYIYDLFSNRNFPINCGPYCCLQRAFATYTSNELKECDYRDIPITVVHPWHGCDTIGFGRNVQQYFNLKDPVPEQNPWRNPTTQIVSKSLSVTQDHHGYKKDHIDKPWERHRLMYVID
jgi:hypothetical protein